MSYAQHLRAASFALVLGAAVALPEHAAVACAAEPIVGSVCIVGFGFCPLGFAEANGQILVISQNTALFSLLGTTYGGDGQRTFALPDLRGRAPVGDGIVTSPGAPKSLVLGEQAGANRVLAEPAPTVAIPGEVLTTTPAVLGVKFCIATEGVFPRRN